MANQVITFNTITLQLTPNAVCVNVSDKNGDTLLEGRLGLTVPSKIQPQIDQSDDKLVIDWPDVSLTVQHCPPPPQRQTTSRKETDGAARVTFKYDFTWAVKNYAADSGKLHDVFSMTNAHWYGASQIRTQEWPIEKWKRKLAPYVAGDSFKKDKYGGVQERYFLSSKGVAIFVSPETPLHIGINDRSSSELSFVAQSGAPYRNPNKKLLTLQYSLFQADNVRECHQLVYGYDVISKPIGIPNEDLFRYPIWSTWAKYKTKINQKVIMEFAKEIKDNGFQASQFEIDDDWTPAYGDWDFDAKKFPDPAKMVADLRLLGYPRVTLWVHPFCSTFSKASGLPLWVGGKLGATTTWWNGLGKCLDVTNPEAVSWFRGQLSSLQQRYGVTSFKFDAGEVTWLPAGHRLMHELDNPSEYATHYSEVAYEADKDNRWQEVRVGIRTQHLPIMVRMMDKDSNWTYDNGLRTLIPHALTFSVIGYPFCLPDMIGGCAYMGKPDRELYIRWMEVNVFLPHIQFSLVPWQYDQGVVRIAHRMMDLRAKYTEKFIQLAKECVQTGAPIVRPLWWIAPHDEQAQVDDSEFLVGDNLLIAPVLDKGATSRDVYLPAGTWRSELTGIELTGARWYSGIGAAIDEVPHFTLVTPSPGLTRQSDSHLASPGQVEPPAVEDAPPKDTTATEGAGN